ncbi:MAG: hypothetical protein M0R80_07810 [Proteobacteria bacterium]|jgi:CRISPR/Cas system-associated endonuclease/helicase Cas3|nr:hypothetical protein [Pseudomonadota bacterium]
MQPLAHSKDDAKGIPEQTYVDHVQGVYGKVAKNLETIRPYVPPDKFQLISVITLLAALLHDLGKLCPNCQGVLQGDPKYRGCKMPNHTDAGAAYMVDKFRAVAKLIQSHHYGFDNFDTDMRDHKTLAERCPHISFKGTMMEYTDGILQRLVELHHKLVKTDIVNGKTNENGFYRLALSILVDADHYDTAKNYKNKVVEKEIPLRAKERLVLLDKFIAELQASSEKTTRNLIKQKVYDACRCAAKYPFTYCSSEVGNGKTTAMLAYALLTNPRKIIYAAPQCNIITQTVDVYRRAVALPGEHSRLVVGEHHHQMEQDIKGLDQEVSFFEKVYATLWESPIVCTTAVQFVETLLSAKTGKLRKYFNLAGSHIIIDESHGSIPLVLWPILLHELKFLVENMGCSVTFASGSMIRLWEHPTIKKLSGFDAEVYPIIPAELSEETLQQEKNRVPIKYDSRLHSLKSICDLILTHKGSKLVVFNTIRNAAMVAKEFRRRGVSVEHLSTALAPEDRDVILKRIKERLKDHPDDDWVVVATSCVETGIDFSFRYGFREIAGLLNVLQFLGRIRRNSELNFFDSAAWVFELILPDYPHATDFTKNPDVANGAAIFRRLTRKYQSLGPEHCDMAIEQEIDLNTPSIQMANGQTVTWKEVMDWVKKCSFRKIHDNCRVIPQDKVTVIPQVKYNELMSQFEEKRKIYGDKTYLDKTDIVRKSFQYYSDKANQSPFIVPIVGGPLDGFFRWVGAYDPDFLGHAAQ